MVDSSSDPHSKSDMLSLRRISSSVFNIPGFFVGLSSKGSPDSDSLRSPTSPLNFSFFSNLSKPFSLRSPRSPSQSEHQKKWDCSKIGLGILNLLDEAKPASEVLDSLARTNIIFGPQVKTGNSVRSKSLPRNYIVSLQSHQKAPSSHLGQLDNVHGNGGVPIEPKSFKNSSQVELTSKSDLNSKEFCSENHTNIITSSPLLIGTASQIGSSLDMKSTSIPIPIGSDHRYVGSLSACEIELSEDYTCIISHGPNPKTTHIFGDCILECHTKEFPNFDKTESSGIELPCEVKNPGSNLNMSNEFLSFCYSCNKKLKGDDIYTYRGEKAFCSFDCRSEEIFAEEETRITCDDSTKSSPESSYHEDIFLIGMPISR